ncbi:MAG TPA: ribosome maturation factor RimM, partial [Anaerolineales bacterium]
LLLAFKEILDRDAVGALRNKLLYVRADDIPALPEGDYYHHQILGLRVYSEDGEFLGTVVDILETGANDVCIVRPSEGSDFLMPVIDSIVLKIDLDQGEMRVRLLEGLR